MNGLDHKGFTIAGAMTMSSLVYDATPFLHTGNMANVFHPDGTPWTWPYLVHQFDTGHFPIFSLETLLKIVFYFLLIQFASLPDRLERRRAGDIGLPTKHRGCTHSCLFLLFLLLAGILLSTFGWQYLVHHRLVFDSFSTRLMTTAMVAIFLTMLLHILADSLTKMGVRAFWPDESLVGVIPREMRFTNTSLGPSLVLWSMYFVAGTLFALGVIGF